MTTLAYAVVRPRAGSIYVDAAVVVAGSLVVAALAQVSVPLPFTPVPVTGQTLGVLLVGAALGPVRGGASMLLYLAEGALGLPFFAEGRSGIEILGVASATGGYLWGFVVAAALVGWLARKGWDRKISSAIGAMVLGEIVIFTFGVLWLAQALDVPVIGAVEKYDDALDYGLYPFLIGDLVKMLVAAGLLPGAWRLVGEQRSRFRR